MDKRGTRPIELTSRFYPASFIREGGYLWAFGVGTSEAVDTYDTAFSLEATREAIKEFDKWRNLRDMHQPVAVGVIPIMELTDTCLRLGAKIVDAEAIKKAEAGVYKGFSLRFAEDYDGHWETRNGKDIFLFTRYSIVEFSLVDRNSNPEALISLFSRAQMNLADKEAGWTFDWKDDCDAILAKLGWDGMKRACLINDGSEDKAGYKLPVMRLAGPDDNALTLYYHGCVAAMAALNGANGDLGLSDTERKAAYNSLSQYYRLFNEKPSELRRMEVTRMEVTKEQLDQEIEKGFVAFFKRFIPGGKDKTKTDDATPAAPEPKGRAAMPKDKYEALKQARADMAAAGASPEALAGMDAAIGGMEPVEAKKDAAPADDEMKRTVAAQAQQIGELKAKLDALSSQRKSQETVEGPDEKVPQSKYRGAFIGTVRD